MSRSRNETAKRSAFSFLDGDVIAADPGSVGEGITISLRREHLVTPRAFTSLKVNQAIVKAFDGIRVLEPWVVYLKPMHENPELSWFDTTGRIGTDPTAAPRPQPLRWGGAAVFEDLTRALRQVSRRQRRCPVQEPAPPAETQDGESEPDHDHRGDP